jgi:3-oxoacyl-[acyl-carrier protein] reductase
MSGQDFLDDYLGNSLGAASFEQAYLPSLRNGPSGSIVFLSTIAAAVGMPFHSSKSMVTAPIEGLTNALAAEVAPALRANCVAPSLTDTPAG